MGLNLYSWNSNSRIKDKVQGFEQLLVESTMNSWKFKSLGSSGGQEVVGCRWSWNPWIRMGFQRYGTHQIQHMVFTWPIHIMAKLKRPCP